MNLDSFCCKILSLILLYHVTLVTCYENFGKTHNYKSNDRQNLKFPYRNTRNKIAYHSPYEHKTSFFSFNIWDTYSNSKIKYKRDCRNNTDTFIARPPNLFYKIKRGDRTLWESYDNKYGYKAIVNYNKIGNHQLTVSFVEYDHVNNRIIPLGHPLVTLNVRHKHSTDFIKYKCQGGIHTFTARNPYLFDLVINGDEVLWTPSEPVYPDKVSVIPQKRGSNILRVFFSYDTSALSKFPITRARKPAVSKPFSGSRDVVKAYKKDIFNFLEDIKIFTEGSSDANDTSKFTVSRFGELDELYMFTFNKGVQCNEIKYEHELFDPKVSTDVVPEDRTVWRHGYNDYLEYPKAIYLHGFFKFMFIEFNDDLFYFYRKSTSHKGWKLVPLQKVTSLDVSKVKILTYGHDGRLKELNPARYLVYDLDFAYQFVLKGIRCEQLKYNDEFLFVHDGSRRYPLFIYLLFNKTCEVVYDNTAHYIYTT